jgi:ADP-ribosylglycohydrolase
VRNAISIGGDSDTIGCIAGSIAEALYDVPQWMKDIALERLSNRISEQLCDVVMVFSAYISQSVKSDQ